MQEPSAHHRGFWLQCRHPSGDPLTPIGRRGKPVKKLRLIPAEDAHAMARHFQGTTVSVT